MATAIPLVIRNKFVGQVMKGSIVINSVLAFLALQPFEPFIDYSTMLFELQIQSLVAPALISLLLPLGIKKEMLLKGEDGHIWRSGSLTARFVSLVPTNKVLACLFWTLLTFIFFTLPAIGGLQLLGVEQMTGWQYFFFKMTQAWIFCTSISYLICSVAVTRRETAGQQRARVSN
ncbi:hypothetical protein [Photobacterium sp. OFAV2-7]|uniref:hypothetical protein n=1 Tax=Photobacterium sp. OFAV2-7 TaxID=2917748 RepID=UPI001EF60C19|nr:hypothetical protein [Photobacterium sp. OFAV2-7]MCG7584325.1 hypothetical protein [Photobacterium sp. OFAV2-7]